MILLYLVFLTDEVVCHELGKGDRAVFSARAAEGYYKLALALMNVKRYQVVYKVGHFVKEHTGLLKAHDIVPDAAVTASMVAKLLNIMRIWQASYVKYQISLRGNSILEAERHYLYNERIGALFKEELLDLLLQL